MTVVGPPLASSSDPKLAHRFGSPWWMLCELFSSLTPLNHSRSSREPRRAKRARREPRTGEGPTPLNGRLASLVRRTRHF
jgi:hypothetical protein